MDQMELIAVRIKDGIFAGNVAAAEDREFLAMNKITHVINCAGGEVANFHEGDPELRYLSFPWKDAAGSVCTTILFDPNDDNINETVQFIDEAMACGDCVLVHSYNGISRSPALIAAYFVVKYGWKLESALSFLQMAHPDVSIKPHFLRQLRLFAKRHPVDHDIFDRNIDDSSFGLDNDQWMLRNTLLNGLTCQEQETNELFHACVAKVDVGARVGKPHPKKTRISFIDTKQGTGVDDPKSVPVVLGKATPAITHADPNASRNGAPADNFIGSQGPSVLRTGRRSPSILSRSTSPCSRHLESDPKTNPKGRQDLKVVPPPRPATRAKSPPLAPSTAGAGAPGDAPPPLNVAAISNTTTPVRPTQGALATPTGDRSAVEDVNATSGRELSVESNQGRASYYERLAPPKPKQGTASTGMPARSPLATLTSKHKYRNGSPLPLVKDKQKGDRKPRTRISSSPSSRSGGGTSTTPTSPRALRSSSASSKDRTGSPGKVKNSHKVKPVAASGSSAGGGVTRGADSRYVAIAPQRSGSASGRPAWNATVSSHERPTVTRPLSPAYQAAVSPGSSPASRPRPRSRSVRSRTSSPGDKERPRRRSTSKQKKRTGSPKSASLGTPSRAPLSPSNASLASSTPDRPTTSPKRTLSASSQNKLKRQPPAAIPSRRQS